MADYVRQQGHDAWTAYEANLQEAKDEELIAYAAGRGAVLITTNKDCARKARRLRAARVIYLAAREEFAIETMERSLDWLRTRRLPAGRVLRVPRRGQIRLTAPLPW